LEKTIEVETIISPKLLTLKTVQLIKKFAPFGLANSKPVFVLKNAVIKNYKLLGREQEHLKLIVTFVDQNQDYEVLAWGKGMFSSEFKINERFDLAVAIESNTYRDFEKVQLVLRDFKKSN